MSAHETLPTKVNQKLTTIFTFLPLFHLPFSLLSSSLSQLQPLLLLSNSMDLLPRHVKP